MSLVRRLVRYEWAKRDIDTLMQALHIQAVEVLWVVGRKSECFKWADGAWRTLMRCSDGILEPAQGFLE